MQKLFLVVIALVIASASFAQKNKKQRKEENRKRVNALIKQEEEGVIAYKKHTVYGGKLTTDGYGIFMEIGRAKSVNKAMLYQLEISERKHVKEQKLSNAYGPSAPIIFGKENFFYPVKLGLQQQMLFGNKSNKNGVSVTGNYGGGIIAGILRPYYVQLSSTGQYIKYNSPDSANFLTISALRGGPGFSKGWNDITVIPGVYAKAGLRFDYGSYNEIVSAIEVGISGEYYTKKIPIMIYQPQKQFFFTGYVAILFGRRK